MQDYTRYTLIFPGNHVSDETVLGSVSQILDGSLTHHILLLNSQQDSRYVSGLAQIPEHTSSGLHYIEKM